MSDTLKGSSQGSRKHKRIIKITMISFMIVIMLLIVGAIFPRPVTAPTQIPEGTSSSKAPYLTVILMDGVHQGVLNSLIDQGRMPNLQKLMNRGATIENGIGAFPSITGFAFYPFVTGEDGARSGIFGLRWFDRTRQVGSFRNYVGRTNVQMNGDLVNKTKTVYELVEPQYTSAFNGIMNRGVARSYLGGWAYTMAKFQDKFWLFRLIKSFSWLNARLAPSWPQAEAAVMDLAIKDLALKPKVQWITLGSPDAHHHLNGTDETYYDLIAGLDALLGKYIQASKELGMSQDHVIMVVTDHGMVDVKNNLDPPDVVAQKTGIKLRRGPAIELQSSELSLTYEDLDAFDGVFAINGNNAAWIYLRGKDNQGSRGWSKGNTDKQLQSYAPRQGGNAANLIKTLQSIDGIELIVSKDNEGNVVVRDTMQDGYGTISFQNGYKYQVIGKDPLSYNKSEKATKLLDGTAHSRIEWLEATVHTQFPYAPVRLYELMNQKGSPDIALTAKVGYDFGKDYEMFQKNYLGGHGGIRADQMRVKYVLAGPGVAPGKIVPVATAEDLGATAIHLLGLTPDAHVSGRVLHEIVE